MTFNYRSGRKQRVVLIGPMEEREERFPKKRDLVRKRFCWPAICSGKRKIFNVGVSVKSKIFDLFGEDVAKNPKDALAFDVRLVRTGNRPWDQEVLVTLPEDQNDG